MNNRGEERRVGDRRDNSDRRKENIPVAIDRRSSGDRRDGSNRRLGSERRR